MASQKAPYWHSPLDRWQLAGVLVLLVVIGGWMMVGARPQAARPTVSSPAPDAVFTVDALPVLRGTAPPGYLIQIYDDDRFLGAVTTDENGDWRYTLPATLFAGEHHLRARSLAKNGSPAGTSEPLTLTIAPASGQTPRFHIRARTYRAGESFVLSGEAPPNVKLAIDDNGARLGQAMSDSDGQWTFEAPGLTAGLHQLTASVLGPNGEALATSSPLAINVMDR